VRRWGVVRVRKQRLVLDCRRRGGWWPRVRSWRRALLAQCMHMLLLLLPQVRLLLRLLLLLLLLLLQCLLLRRLLLLLLPCLQLLLLLPLPRGQEAEQVVEQRPGHRGT